MLYTAEQLAQLALQLSDTIQRYETEQRITTQLRSEKHELQQQNDNLYQQIAVLQNKIAKLEEIARYE